MPQQPAKATEMLTEQRQSGQGKGVPEEGDHAPSWPMSFTSGSRQLENSVDPEWSSGVFFAAASASASDFA